MTGLKTLFSTHEDWLMEQVLAYAKERGYTKYTSSLFEAWRVSIAGLTHALSQAVDTFGDTGLELAPDENHTDDPITAFAVKESRLHRERGVDLAMFLGLLKYYRQAYLDCLREHCAKADKERYAAFTGRFFDRLEIGLCADWTTVSSAEQIEELQAFNRIATNEKNRFLTLFESLATPVLLLDTQRTIQAMNLAAARCLGVANQAGELYYAMHDPTSGPEELDKPTSLDEIAPWLREAIDRERGPDGELNGLSFEASTPPALGSQHFSVSISNMADVSDKFTGLAIVMEDVTRRVETERQLAQERNRATYYLDVVGSVLLGLDASGAITLINKTGCRILGYEQHELLGRNWVDTVIPEEQHDEVRDYLYAIFTDGIDVQPEHVNYVTTKDGDHLLISWKNSLLTNENDQAIGILSSGLDITEQRAAEEALAEKELWLRNTFVALGEAVIILTPDRTIIDVNPAAEEMFGMDNVEFEGAPVEILHMDQKHYKQFTQKSDAAFAKDEPAHFEFTMRRKDGSTFPTEHTTSLITGDDGAPIGIVNVVRDISKRKQAESRLRRSEEKFRSIFETIEEGYIVTDLDGTITLVNPATCQLLGYDEADIVGQDMAQLYSDQEERARFREALGNKGNVRGFQLSARRKDDSVVVVEANARLVLDSKGIPTGMEGTFHDITQRIEAEKVIRESEKQYRAFFENNHAIMLLVEPQTGHIVDANPAASEFYGYSRETMRTMSVDQINVLEEKDIFQEMALAHSEQRSYFLFRHVLADKEIRDVEVYSGPIMVHDRQLLYSVIHDVTKRVRLERKMKQLATTDTLTGVNNRHQFFSLAATELRRALRYKHPMTVLMLDIDYFKSINDNHGHQTGDVVLKGLASMAIATLRETDVFGRIGGEEFTAVLPETGLKEGMLVAERLREALGKLAIVIKEEEIHFTVSIGVTLAKRTDKTIEEVINRADEALYKAKRTGRNRVVRV